MRSILVKFKGQPADSSPVMVYPQGDGQTYRKVSDGKVIAKEDILFPVKNDVQRRDYDLAALQGLLANPDVTSQRVLSSEKGYQFIVAAADRISSLLYYNDVDTFEPLP